MPTFTIRSPSSEGAGMYNKKVISAFFFFRHLDVPSLRGLNN